MKNILLLILSFFAITASAQDVKSLKWGDVCGGKMPTAWYSSQEAQDIADIVLNVQKNNGGWMKNDQLHNLTANEYAVLKTSRSEHSCLDNYATTQEMRFLARVYQGTKVEKYRESIVKALNMILAAELKNGGWGQYWPLTNDQYSYQNYITFNDDLVTNVMKMLRDIYENKGMFENLVDEATREKCRETFNRNVQTIIKCQIDDNGTKAAWCAQHDPNDFLPTEGRPHELPSVSGFESANLLSFLMTIEDPSTELQECITSAVKWLDAHKIEGKAIEDFKNAKGESDRRIIDKAGSNIWGRFIQIGGESGKQIFNKFVKKLQARGKSRSYTYNGKSYTFKEYEIAQASYDFSKEYQPIFAIYSDDYAHLYYRYLYNYADSDPYIDANGCIIYTSLFAGNRASYQYLGSWCQNIINVEYPAWKQKVDAKAEAGDAVMYELAPTTYKSSATEGSQTQYIFDNGIVITNEKGKGYGAGKNNTIKYSAGVQYSIQVPKDQQIVKVSFNGYDNYEGDAYISELNGQSFEPTAYVFPSKVGGEAVNANHTIDLSAAPAVGTLTFTLGNKQCCLGIIVYCTESNGIASITADTIAAPVKAIDNGRVVIRKNGNTYNVAGQRINL